MCVAKHEVLHCCQAQLPWDIATQPACLLPYMYIDGGSVCRAVAENMIAGLSPIQDSSNVAFSSTQPGCIQMYTSSTYPSSLLFCIMHMTRS